MDCYFSYENGKDSFGRVIDERIKRINAALKVTDTSIHYCNSN